MYERVLESRVQSIRRSVLVLGPRQVGKSTLLHRLQPDKVVDLASPMVFGRYIAHPEELEAELAAAPPRVRTVLIDEVQKVPALLDVVQVFSDRQPDRFRFLLSGSSARKLRRGKANLLPGRVITLPMHPLLAVELRDDFDVDRSLAHGALPAVYAETDPVERGGLLRSYANTYIREEVQAEALVRDLGGFSRLLNLVAATSGRILNVSALAQDAGIRFDSARRFVGVLEDTLVAFLVPAWRGSDRASLIAHPRVFLFDVGVRNALLGRPLDRPLPDERGYLLEHLVAHEIHSRLGELWPEAALYHFRTKAGAEVDFVIEADRELWAIEVKASRSVSARDLTGLRAMADRLDAVKRKTVVYLGQYPQLIDGIEVLPIEGFLSELPN
ncbi:MAG: ATP-binding protein [Actinomycetota bacterium]